MARLTAAVNIITSNGPAGLCGCTASAVCSVSDVPPILLVCINRGSRNNAVLKQNQRLCVNVLRGNQQALAEQFGRSGSAAELRFAEADWIESAHADADLSSPGSGLPMPILKAALVSLDCRVTDNAEVGSHTVFYCTVERIRQGEPGAGLAYFERGFHAVPPAAPPAGMS